MKRKRVRLEDIRRVVIYVRVSTPEQAEKDLSLPAQQDAIERHCALKGWEIVLRYVEPGATATDDKRPVFQRMITELLSGSAMADAVVVYHTSRFMRNVHQAQAYKRALVKAGIRVVAINQATSDDPNGRLMETVWEAFDQYESEVNGVRTAAAMQRNARTGYFNGSNPPYGYGVDRVEISPGVLRNKIVPNADEAELLRTVFELYVERSGAVAVAKELNGRGLRYRGGEWHKNLVLKIVGESAPTGTYRWGKRGKAEHWTDDNPGIDIAVEPIIDRDLFDMAQKVRAQRDPDKNPGRTPSSPLLLAGLVKCGSCGEAYTLRTSGKEAPNPDDRYRYYDCRTAIRKGRTACHGAMIPERVLDKAVLEHIADQLYTQERCAKLLAEVIGTCESSKHRVDDQRRHLKRELDETERKIQRWNEAFESGTMPQDVGIDRLRELKTLRAELASTMAKVVPFRPPPASIASQANVDRFLQAIRDIFVSGKTPITKLYLRYLIDSIVVRDNEVTIIAKTESTLSALAEAGSARGLSTTPTAVRTSDTDWLQL